MAGWTGTFGLVSSFDVFFISSVSSPGRAITKEADLQKGGFCGAIETSAMTPLVCRPWAKSPSILKWTNEKVCRQTIRPRLTRQWLGYVEAIYNVMVLTSKLIHTQLVCKRGSLHLYASQPSRTKPLYQDNILLLSKEDGHDVKQLNDEEATHGNWLSGGWIKIQDFYSKLRVRCFHEIHLKPSNFRSFCFTAPPSPE